MASGSTGNPTFNAEAGSMGLPTESVEDEDSERSRLEVGK